MRYKNILSSAEEYSIVKDACAISVEILKELKKNTVVGISPREIDEFAGWLCERFKVKSSFFGVPGVKNPFPSNSCVLVNDESVHAIPKSKIPLKSGDLVKVDFGIVYRGFNTDHGFSKGIGTLSDRENELISIVELSVESGIKKAIAGNLTGEISYVLGEVTKMSGFHSVDNFGGHGIGKEIHMSPSIPFFGSKYSGERLQKDMIICVENWITLGVSDLILEKDGWTLKTKDGSKSAMAEHMVIVRDGSPEVLTRMD